MSSTLKLNDMNLDEEVYFVAMEYYGLILNRTYLVMILDDHIVGIVCNGVVSSDISAEPGPYRLTRRITKSTAKNFVISENLNSPFSCISDKHRERYDGVDLLSDDISKIDRANFRYPISSIISIKHDPKKKWGMGEYPHDGKVNIRVGKIRKELIVLGAQSGASIVKAMECSKAS